MIKALVLSWALTCGINAGVIAQYDGHEITSDHFAYPVFSSLECDASLGALFVSGEVRTDMWYNNRTTFYPFNMTYRISGGLRLGAVEIGIDHACIHPIITWQDYTLGGPMFVTPRYEGAIDTFYIRLSSRK